MTPLKNGVKRLIVIHNSDTGSYCVLRLSSDKYFGHDQYEVELIADRFGNDSFAGMYVAVVRGYLEYREKFPNTWRYIEALLKK